MLPMSISDIEENIDWDDKCHILLAIKEDRYDLFYASERLRDDKDVVLLAIKKDGGALSYASKRLRDELGW